MTKKISNTLKASIAAARPVLVKATTYSGTPLQDRPLTANAGLFWVNNQFLFKWVDGDRESSKFLSPAAVKMAFTNEATDSGWLPPGVIRCGVVKRGHYEVMFIPAHTRELVFVNCSWFDSAANKGKKNVVVELRLPSLFFVGVGPEYRMFAAKEKTFSSKMLLYQVPLPNVSERGPICWGSMQPPRAGQGNIARAWEVFCMSPFSDHNLRDKSVLYPIDIRETYATCPLDNHDEHLVLVERFTPDAVLRDILHAYS